MASIGDVALATLLGVGIGGVSRQVLPEKNSGRGGRGSGAGDDSMAPSPIEFDNTLQALTPVEAASPEEQAARKRAVAFASIAGGSMGGAGSIPAAALAASGTAQFDTQLGEAMAAVQNQQKMKAASTAARLADRLRSRNVSLGEKQRLTQQFNDTYGDIGIKAQPYNKEQAAQLQRLDLMTQHRATAAKMGMPPEIVSGVDNNGNAIINPLVNEAQQIKRQNEVLARAETAQLRQEGRDEKDLEYKRRQDKINGLNQELLALERPEKPTLPLGGLGPGESGLVTEYNTKLEEYNQDKKRIRGAIASLYNTGKLPEETKTPAPTDGAFVPNAGGQMGTEPQQAGIRQAPPSQATVQAAAAKAKAEGLDLVMTPAEAAQRPPGPYMAAWDGRRHIRREVAGEQVASSGVFPTVTQPTISKSQSLSDILMLAPVRK